MANPFPSLPDRDPAWLRHVRTLRCCLTGERSMVEAHHVRLAGMCGVSQKPPDYMTVPMTTREHRRIHAEGMTVEDRAAIYERLVYLLNEYMERMVEEEF